MEGAIMVEKNIKSNMLFNVLKALLSVIFPIITFSYVSRVLSVEAVGRVTFAKNIASYFVLIATLGVNYYGIREAARLKHNKYELSKLFWEVFIINAIATVFSAFVLLISSFSASFLLDYRNLLIINVLGVILGGLSCEWIISAKEEYKFIAIRYTFIQIVCVVLMFCFIHNDGDDWKYAVLLIITGYGSTIFNYLYIIKQHIIQWIPIKKWRLRKHIKPIFILFFMLVSIELYTVLDTTMLGLIKDDRNVGIYTAAIKIPRMVNSMITACGAVLVPRLSYYYDENRRKFNSLLDKALQIVIILTIPCAIGVFMLSDGIITLLCGSQYTDAFITSKILSFLILIIPFSVLFNNQVFIPMRKEKHVLTSTLTGAAVNLILNSILIPRFAENGAAFASVIAEFSVMCVCFHFVKKELGNLNLLKKYRGQLLKAVSVFICTLLCCIIIDNVIFRLFIAAITSILIYFLICKKNIFRLLQQM